MPGGGGAPAPCFRHVPPGNLHCAVYKLAFSASNFAFKRWTDFSCSTIRS